jgi:hypothetical protein
VVEPLDTELVEDYVHAHRMEVNVPLKVSPVSPPSFWGMLAHWRVITSILNNVPKQRLGLIRIPSLGGLSTGSAREDYSVS